MLAIKLFFCFAATLVFFSGVSTYYIPNNGTKVTCVRACESQLKGKTFSCDMYSSQGIVKFVVRMVVELNWRFYILPNIASESTFCERVLAADQYFANGTGRCPSSVPLAKMSPIDTKQTESTRRGEDLKRLLKELKENSTEVLTTLEKSAGKIGFRSLSEAITPQKKSDIKLVLEKLVQHLSNVGWLNEDIKFHYNNDNHLNNPSQHKQPSHPNLSSGPSYPGSSSQTGYPGTTGQTGYPGVSSQAGYSGASSQAGFSGASSQASYSGASGQAGYPPQMNFRNPYSVYDYNQIDQNDVPKSYDYNMNNDDMYKYDDAKNLGPDQHPFANANHFQPPTDFSQVPPSRKRGEEAKEDEETKVDEIKELTSKLKVESSELLKELATDTPPDSSSKKKNAFVKFIRHLLKLLGLIKDDDIDEDDTSPEDESPKNEESKLHSNDNLNNSQAVEGRALLEQRLDTNSAKRKLTHDSENERGECALCTVVLRDICNDGKIVVCDDTVCCWMSFNPFYCMVTSENKSALTCYNSLFNILRSSSTHVA